MRKLIVILLVLVGCFQAKSQGIDPRLGYDLFKATNYLDAMTELKKHLKVDPKDAKALYHIGLCYLNTNIDKRAAITYFEKCIATEKCDGDCKFYLAIAHSHNYEYDKAISLLEEYISASGKETEDAKKKIEQYKEAKELYSHPVDVSFENLGDKNNSPYPDYAPFCSKDEKFIVFTSRREEGKGNKEFDGYYPSDIFITKYDGFRFSGVKPASVNSNFDESCVGIYDDGSKIFLYFDNITEKGEIYESVESGGGYSKKKKIPEGVNDEKSIETAASISSDEQTFFFASNREGSKGGLDLYMTRKLPDGKWALPQNISAINSSGHEDFPSLAADGNTLYFCSDGLGGMGGYDLFKTTWNPETNEFSKPENLGYPINTSYDDKVICFTADGKHAYVSQVREEGYGDLDIYRVTFNEEEEFPAVYSVKVEDGVSLGKISDFILYVYNESDEIIGEYHGNEDRDITMILPPGKYSIEIESDGYQVLVQDLKVSEFDYQKDIINLSYKLTK